MTFRLKEPVFLLASERSGGNLTRAIIGAHPDFYAPAPIHFLRVFDPLIPLYGDLRDDANFGCLCKDVARFSALQVGGGSLAGGKEALFVNAVERSLIGLFDALYAGDIARTKTKRFFAKENDTILFVHRLILAYPDARFIYLVRDPRDVAASWSKSLNHPGGVATAARLWAHEQRLAGSVLSDPAVRERSVIIHYESLVKDPKRIAKSICALLNVPFHDAMLDFYKEDDIVAQSKAVENWRNLSKPVDSSSAGKFLSELSRGQIHKVEAIAGAEMRMFGYTPVSDGVERKPSIIQRRVIPAAQRLYKLAYGARFRRGELIQRRKRLAGLESIQDEAKARQKPLFSCDQVSPPAP